MQLVARVAFFKAGEVASGSRREGMFEISESWKNTEEPAKHSRNRFPDSGSASIGTLGFETFVGLAPRLVGSGEHEEVKSAGNRKKKQLHYLLIESAWRAARFNLEYRARYGLLIAKGTNPQRAITIIAKKLLMSIHAVWTQDRNFKVLLPRTK